MFQTATRLLTRYFTYYAEGLAGWWDNIGLNQYLALLIAALFLGFWLLKADPMKTL